MPNKPKSTWIGLNCQFHPKNSLFFLLLPCNHPLRKKPTLPCFVIVFSQTSKFPLNHNISTTYKNTSPSGGGQGDIRVFGHGRCLGSRGNGGRDFGGSGRLSGHGPPCLFPFFRPSRPRPFRLVPGRNRPGSSPASLSFPWPP